MNVKDIPACVEAGALHLDDVCPGWHELILVNRLDLNNGYLCVLGQLSTTLNALPLEAMFVPNPDLNHDFDVAGYYAVTEVEHFGDGCVWAPPLAALGVTPTTAVNLGFTVAPSEYVPGEPRSEQWGALNSCWYAEIMDRVEEDTDEDTRTVRNGTR